MNRRLYSPTEKTNATLISAIQHINHSHIKLIPAFFFEYIGAKKKANKKETAAVGCAPTPRELFIKSSTKNFILSVIKTNDYRKNISKSFWGKGTGKPLFLKKGFPRHKPFL